MRTAIQTARAPSAPRSRGRRRGRSRDRALRHRRRQIEAVDGVERRVDAAGPEVRVDQSRGRRRLIRPEVVGVTDLRQHDLATVREMGRSSRCAICGGVAKSSSPPISRVGTRESRTVVYWFSSGFAGHASSSRPPAQTRSVPGLPMTEPWLPPVAKNRFAEAASPDRSRRRRPRPAPAGTSAAPRPKGATRRRRRPDRTTATCRASAARRAARRRPSSRSSARRTRPPGRCPA